MTHQTLGIIGGAGVAATNTLLTLLEEHFTRNGAFRDAHHPETIAYYATQAPSRSMFLEGRGPSFVEDYVAVGRKLTAAGATVLCMSCNSAHAAFDQIEAEVQAPFINMIDMVGTRVHASFPGKRIGLIASDGCLASEVYERAFGKLCPGATIVYPDGDHQAETTRGICNVKTASRFLPAGHPDRPATIFGSVCGHLRARGADAIVLGCTDIAVDFRRTAYDGVPLIDSLTVLADSCCRHMEQGASHEE